MNINTTRKEAQMQKHHLEIIVLAADDAEITVENIANAADIPPYRVRAELKRIGLEKPTRAEAIELLATMYRENMEKKLPSYFQEANMGRIHSADIARRANKKAWLVDSELRWIKKHRPELWAELEAQEAARKSQLEITSSNNQTAWTLSAAGADAFLDYLGLPRQEPEPLADILLDRRVDADKLIEIMIKKLGGNPPFWRVQAARLVGCNHNASTITLTQQQAIQLLSKGWDSE